MRTWIRDALDFSKIGQSELARRLTSELGRSIDRAAVNKMINGSRKVKADEMLAIAKITGFATPSAEEQDIIRNTLRKCLESSKDYSADSIDAELGGNGEILDFLEGKSFISPRLMSDIEVILRLPIGYLWGRSEITPEKALKYVDSEEMILRDYELKYGRKLFERNVDAKPLPKREQRDRLVPVYGSAEGGDGSMVIDAEPVEWAPRPNIIPEEDDLYGVVIEGTSMLKAYRPGDTAWLHPKYRERRDEPCVFRRHNDITGDTSMTIKWLIDFNSQRWLVEQFNPPKEFELKRADWPECYRVLGKKNRA